MPGTTLSPGTHPGDWLVSFKLTGKAQPALLKEPGSALPERGHIPDTAVWVPANRARQSAKLQQLALVCLQVLADRRNAPDHYHPTQRRSAAQPSHIWKM